MLRIILSLFMLFPAPLKNLGAVETGETALLLIDIQNFYFPGGKAELSAPVKAAENAAHILTRFREKGGLVVHVRHLSEPGGEIHSLVKPVEGEKIISKKAVNSFRDTDLLETLRENGIKRIVVCGMMTHMCVEAAVRAADDFGFDVILIGDACATRSLKFEEMEISAKDVHASTLAALNRSYAEIMTTRSWLDRDKLPGTL